MTATRTQGSAISGTRPRDIASASPTKKKPRNNDRNRVRLPAAIHAHFACQGRQLFVWGRILLQLHAVYLMHTHTTWT